jgi:hypothetical protein
MKLAATFVASPDALRQSNPNELVKTLNWAKPD